ncbi:MAG: DUF3795 domain-containing protein [Candidatus Thorarchaeota archaeon]|jgi:hypothetical protein
MKYEEEKRRYISFCGSYCHTCDWHSGTIRKTAQATLSMLDQYGGFTKLFGRNEIDADNLARGLEVLANSGICSGCKAEIPDYSGGEEERCEIRRCCSGKGYSVCSECDDFPCELLKNNPGVVKFHTIENLKDIDRIGLERWIDEWWKRYIMNQI